MSHDATWVARMLALAADQEIVYASGGRRFEVWVDCASGLDVLGVTIYRPGVEEPVATARVTVELIVAEEPDPTPDEQWQVTSGGPHHDAEYRAAWDESAGLHS